MGRRTIPVLLVLLALVLALGAAPAAAVADCNGTSTGLIPLTDLGTAEYLGSQGGLYPGGSNEIPDGHRALGETLASQVAPRGPDGQYSADGKIVIISIGVSNTLAQFNGFTTVIEREGGVNPSVLIANTAQTGRALGQWAQQSSDQTWNRADQRIQELGGTPEQVQVAWMMLPPRTRGPRTLDQAEADLAPLVRVVQNAKERYPNLALMYVSSRMYGGYVPDADSEPNAYQHGFSVKWLIEQQIDGSSALNADSAAGSVVAPWLAWGPYLWADGLNPRSDGLIWECSDYANDGVHPGETTGAVKVGQMLYDHFMDDPTASWFDTDGSAEIPPPTDPPSTTSAPDLAEGAESTVPSNPEVAPDTARRQSDAASTDRVRRDDQSGASVQAEAARAGWPAATIVGVGLAGVVLGAIAGAAGTRLWFERSSRP